MLAPIWSTVPKHLDFLSQIDVEAAVHIMARWKDTWRVVGAQVDDKVSMSTAPDLTGTSLPSVVLSGCLVNKVIRVEAFGLMAEMRDLSLGIVTVRGEKGDSVHGETRHGILARPVQDAILFNQILPYPVLLPPLVRGSNW